MARKSLYLKYRPQDFENFVGQEYVRKTLINSLKADNVAHAYLFTGPRGTGKTSSARLIAKALNCENLKDGYDPCNHCDICRDINDGRLIDLIEIDAASNRGIDEVRELKDKINFAPTRAKYKIYIIDEVHMMTKEAFNALLKTLEEPPDHSYFILATTEVHKIPETIISRCQRFDFRRFSQEELVGRLSAIAEKEGFEVEDGSLEVIARYVDGGMRDAIGLLEQLNVDGKIILSNVKRLLGVSDLSLLSNLFKTLQKKEVTVALKIVEEVYVQGSDLQQFCHDFVEFMRERMLQAVAAGKQVGGLLNWIEIFQKARLNLSGNIPQLALEIAVIECCGFDKVEDFEAAPVQKKVEKVEEKVETKVMEKAPEVEKIVEAVSEKREHQSLEKLEDFKKHWSEIVEGVKTPSLRMSLKNSRPIEIVGSEVKLEFGSSFYKTKVDDHDNRVELEGKIKELFGVEIKVVTLVNEGSFEPEPVIHKAEAETGLDELDKREPAPVATAVDAALDIFGGELVE